MSGATQLLLEANARMREQFSGTSAAAAGAATQPPPVGSFMPWTFYGTDEQIDEHIALTLSVVWACVMAIAEGIAASDWQTYLENEDGERTQVRGPLHRVLNERPNPEQSAFDFYVTLYANALLSRGGFAELVRDRRDYVHSLWPIRSIRVRRERREGELGFLVHNYSSADVWVHHTDMVAIRTLSLDGENAAPLIDFARSVLSRAKATRDFGSSFYANGTTFGGMFIPKDGVKIDGKAREDFLKSLRQTYGGARNAHGNLLLPAAMDYKSFGIDPDKAQFIQTEQHLVEEVCRYFRVPPHKVQHLLRATFSNIEHLGIEFVRDAVTPWAHRLRDEYNWKVCAFENLKCRADLDWLREGDAESVAKAESTRISSAQSSPDEARRRRGDNPIPGGAGAQFYMQGAMTTLDAIADAPNQDAPSVLDQDRTGSDAVVAMPVRRRRAPKD